MPASAARESGGKGPAPRGLGAGPSAPRSGPCGGRGFQALLGAGGRRGSARARAARARGVAGRGSRGQRTPAAASGPRQGLLSVYRAAVGEKAPSTGAPSAGSPRARPRPLRTRRDPRGEKATVPADPDPGPDPGPGVPGDPCLPLGAARGPGPCCLDPCKRGSVLTVFAHFSWETLECRRPGPCFVLICRRVSVGSLFFSFSKKPQWQICFLRPAPSLKVESRKSKVCVWGNSWDNWELRGSCCCYGAGRSELFLLPCCHLFKGFCDQRLCWGHCLTAAAQAGRRPHAATPSWGKGGQ